MAKLQADQRDLGNVSKCVLAKFTTIAFLLSDRDYKSVCAQCRNLRRCYYDSLSSF